MKTNRLMALAAALALVACGASELLGPGAPQGIDGMVLLGPMCPVVQVDDPCPDQPYQARIDVLTAGGAFVTSVESNAEGRFRVGLRPGAYVLAPRSGNPFPTAGEQEALVVEGEYTDVVVSFDTGIRQDAVLTLSAGPRRPSARGSTRPDRVGARTAAHRKGTGTTGPPMVSA
ncbi:MAG: hypothetical protein FJ207_09180 [Gemmatimonadetes bacterium]|nr:hypothetical protein [Gemmatimonadota bacterium]